MREQKLIKLKSALRRHHSDRSIDLFEYRSKNTKLLDCKLIVKSLSELLDTYLEKFIIIIVFLFLFLYFLLNIPIFCHTHIFLFFLFLFYCSIFC